MTPESHPPPLARPSRSSVWRIPPFFLIPTVTCWRAMHLQTAKKRSVTQLLERAKKTGVLRGFFSEARETTGATALHLVTLQYSDHPGVRPAFKPSAASIWEQFESCRAHAQVSCALDTVGIRKKGGIRQTLDLEGRAKGGPPPFPPPLPPPPGAPAEEKVCRVLLL